MGAANVYEGGIAIDQVYSSFPLPPPLPQLIIHGEGEGWRGHISWASGKNKTINEHLTSFFTKTADNKCIYFSSMINCCQGKMKEKEKQK